MLNKLMDYKKYLDPNFLFVTFFGIGKIPVAPGTFGTLAGFAVIMVFFNFMEMFSRFTYKLGSFYLVFYISLWVLNILLFVQGVISSNIYSKAHEKEDPKEVVIDEVVGMITTMLLILPIIYTSEISNTDISFSKVVCIINILPFALFRLFDILKPWPISYCDKNIKGGIGIMLDDLVAAFFAALVFHGIFFILLDKHII